MDDQLECTAVTQTQRREVTHIARGQATDAECLGERDDRSIYEPKAKVRVTPIDVHGSGELVERGRGVRKCAAGKIPHERCHCLPLVAKEVVELGKHQGRHITSAGLVDSVSKQPMVRSALDKVVE